MRSAGSVAEKSDNSTRSGERETTTMVSNDRHQRPGMNSSCRGDVWQVGGCFERHKWVENVEKGECGIQLYR